MTRSALILSDTLAYTSHYVNKKRAARRPYKRANRPKLSPRVWGSRAQPR